MAFSAFSTPSFSFGSTPSAFSTTTSSPFSTPGFGSQAPQPPAAPSTAFSFPSLSQPAASAAPTQPSLFSMPAPSNPFGAPSSSPLSFTPAPASSPFSFASALAPASAPATSTPAFSFATLGAPSTTTTPAIGSTLATAQQGTIKYSTKWEELTPDQQRQFSEIQKEINSYREDCEKLDKEQRLQDSSALKKGMEEDTSSLKQTLQTLLHTLKADEDILSDFKEKVRKLLKSTEAAVQTFQRSKVWREAPQVYKGQMLPPAVQELLSAPVVLPSPFLEQAIEGFNATVQDYNRCLSEVEQVLSLTGSLSGQRGGDDSNTQHALATIINNMHEYFVYVTAKAAALHTKVAKAKEMFLHQRRQQGEYSDPFETMHRRHHMTSASKPVVIPAAPSLGSGHAPATSSMFSHPGSSPALPQPSGSPAGFGSAFNMAAPAPAAGAPAPTSFFGAPASPASDLNRRNTSSSQRRRK